VDAHPLIVLRSFSKARGLAGLRLGYGIASAEIIGLLEKLRRPYNVSALAQAAGVASLADRAYLDETIERVARGRRDLSRQLESLGLPYVPSHTNFILVQAGARAASIVEGLRARGCYIRLVGDGWVRVTVGTPRDNDVFVEAVRRLQEFQTRKEE
jgi:histidinol-phosphate aminotransferase